MSEWVSSRALDAVIAGPPASCDVAAAREGVGTIEPYGRTLLNLVANGERARALRDEASLLPSVVLNQRQVCDLEMVLNGGFSPLRGFMDSADYYSVLDEMRLADGTFWPIPVTLDVDTDTAVRLDPGARIALRDADGLALAILTVDDVWEPDKEYEVEMIYGTPSLAHGGVAYLMRQTGSHYVGGTLEGFRLPVHYDYPLLRLGPRALRAIFQQRGWSRVAAFRACDPLDPDDYELARGVAGECGAGLLLHPIIGMERDDDLQHHRRVRGYCQLSLSDEATEIALLPLAMRMAGPRETLWHAIIQRNYGCTHLLLGPRHGSPGNGSHCLEYYSSPEMKAMFGAYSQILGIEILPLPQRFIQRFARPLPLRFPQPREMSGGMSGAASSGAVSVNGGTQCAARDSDGKAVTSWIAFRNPAAVRNHMLTTDYPKGLTIFLTGLSGADASMFTRALLARLLEATAKPVSLLTEDVLDRELGGIAGSLDRDLRLRLMGYVAGEITKHGGIAVCVYAEPVAANTGDVREQIEPHGGFAEVHIEGGRARFAALSDPESQETAHVATQVATGLAPHEEETGCSGEPRNDLEKTEIGGTEIGEVGADISRLAIVDAVESILASLLRKGLLQEADGRVLQ